MAEYYITRKQARELGEALIKEAEAPGQSMDNPLLKPIVFVTFGFSRVPIEAITLRVIDKRDIATIFIWP